MNEFSPREGSVRKGIVAAIAASVKFVFIPYLIVASTSALLAEVPMEGMAEQIGLGDVTNYMLILGIPLIVLSFFRGFYSKGSYSRAVFGVITAALAGLWIWMVTLGGKLEMEFEQVGVTVDLSGFVYLMLLGIALKGAYHVVEMVSYRQEWLRSRSVPGEAESGPAA